MITLTKTEIRWMLKMVNNERTYSSEMMKNPTGELSALHKLNYENMASLSEKLETVINSDCKRIATRW